MTDYFHYYELILVDGVQPAPGRFVALVDTSTLARVDLYGDLSGTPIVSTSGVANMAKTDDLGNVSAYVAPGTYHVDIFEKDATTFVWRIPNVSMTSTKGEKGDAGPQGATGPADNTYTDLATFKASSVDRKVASLSGIDGVPDGKFFWETANAPYTADDTNIIKSDANDLSVGAWVRQAAANIRASDGNTVQDNLDHGGYSKRDGDNSVTLKTEDRINQLPVSPDDKGATDLIDSTAAIQAAMDQYGAASAIYAIEGNGKAVWRPQGLYLVSGSITVPHGLEADLSRCIIQPHPDADISDFYPYDGNTGYIFLMNADSDGNQVVAGGGAAFPQWRNGIFNNLDEDKNPILEGLKAFWLKGSHGFRNFDVWGMYSFATKNTTGTGDNYTDRLRFKDIFLRSSRGSDWMIDLSYLGDDVEISGVRCSLDPENRNVLRMDRCKSGSVSGSINNNMLFLGCKAVTVRNFHLERGSIEARGCSSFTLEDGYIQRNQDTQGVNDPITGSSLGYACPLRIFRLSSSALPGTTAIRNVEVAVPGTGAGQAQEASDVDMSDLVIDTVAPLDIANFVRSFDAGSAGLGELSGALVTRYGGGSSDAGAPASLWSNVAAMASKKSYYASNIVDIAAGTCPIPASYAINAASTSSNASFAGPSDTYYYKFVVLHGPVDRLLGRIIAEKSMAVTNGGNAPFFAFSENPVARPGYTNATLRVYRGTTSGSYNKYVDIPLINRLSFFDLGFYTGTGLYWKSRDAGDIDSFETSSDFYRVVSINDRNCTVYSTGDTLPSAGSYVAGDQFIGATKTAFYGSSGWLVVTGTAPA